ncbi:hypothetical protein GCM10025867_49670 (plasmid) [Frondihabitans sucicola]|uniref:Uncharacterized protein n=1 Tax=Frondihabitans sucicola TaxID=1268041 RepID=A0ABM8GW72_9MICO|nr:hypothetical protein [Frondihabitans sucicola]BDZ52726.1 hypothetical protein GCM10025867_49670 [Frondihabitans sucicola]
MALKFEVCTVCQEDHAVRADGHMSIHTDRAGQRCAGSGPTAVEIAERHRIDEARAAADRLHRQAEEAVAARTEPRPKLRGKALDDDPELQEAFGYANDFRHGVADKAEPARFDRRIYAVSGAREVRGGLPTLGRGRR